MVSDFCRFYPAFTPKRIMQELTRTQFNAMLEQAYKRPWIYACMVEPKGNQ